MKRIDTEANEAYWKIAIVGQGGTGKTSMGVSAPQPLVLLSERQGMPSIKLAAKRLGRPVPPVALVEDATDYRAALMALRGPKDKPFRIVQDNEVVMELPVEQWPQSVVLDSLTDACDVLVTEIRKQSPQRNGRDGLPVDAQRFWGVLIDRATNLIKCFRDLPLHVVFLCLISDKVKEDGEGRMLERIVQPKLATKDMANTLCAAVNVMGYAYKAVDSRKQTVFGFTTAGPEGMMTKPCEPLRNREVPDVASWIDRLTGNLASVPAMPLPQESMDPKLSGGNQDKPPDEPSTPTGFIPCSRCGHVAVGSEGAICGACEDDVFGDDDQPADTSSSGGQPEEPDSSDAPAEEPEGVGSGENLAPGTPMRPCEQCGRRMSVKTYDSGKRRKCESGPGELCVPGEAPKPREPQEAPELADLKGKLADGAS